MAPTLEASALRIETERLLIRPPQPGDEEAVASICSGEGVHANTLTIPTPYTIDDAKAWIEKCAAGRESGAAYAFLTRRKSDGEPIGTCGLTLEAAHDRAELGYVVAEAHRGQGYAREAAEAMLRFGFETLGMHRIFGAWFPHNPTSGRILERIGMKYEGILRGHLKKGDTYLDDCIAAILRPEWEQRRR